MMVVVVGRTGPIGGNVVRLVTHGHDAVPASLATGVDTITAWQHLTAPGAEECATRTWEDLRRQVAARPTRQGLTRPWRRRLGTGCGTCPDESAPAHEQARGVTTTELIGPPPAPPNATRSREEPK
jgi:hypothetical protein